MRKARLSQQEYWEKNIEGYSGFYEECSQELLQASPMLTSAYKAIIFPMEKMVTRQRFEMASSYIAKNVRPGVQVADIGCGGGVYTKKMASLGGKVHALDFADSAIKLTKDRLSLDESKNVVFTRMDIMSQPIPKVDIAIAIGVTPYVDRMDQFLGNILPFTDSFLFNFLDLESWANRVRRKFTVLDVRGYSYYSKGDIRRALTARDFEVVGMEKLGTGFMVESRRKRAKAISS